MQFFGLLDMRKRVTGFIAVASAAAMLVCAVSASAAETRAAVEGAYAWKKGECAAFAEALSPGDDDWFALAAAEGGLDCSGYLEKLEQSVALEYENNGGLDKNKATEWHRTAMTVKALGGDPRNFGGRDLVKDGVTEPLVKLDRQGINGLIFAALTAELCDVPEEKISELCGSIVSRQNEDGGFSVRGGSSDPDVTAMAIRALCGAAGFEAETARAREALEAMRLPSGGFSSGGSENSESTSQVILALCALGERPNTDVDVLLSYRNPDGGFAHLPGGASNNMASAQAMLALVAYEKTEKTENAEKTEAPKPQAEPLPEAAAPALAVEIPAEEPAPAAEKPEQIAPETAPSAAEPRGEEAPKEAAGEAAQEAHEEAPEGGAEEMAEAVDETFAAEPLPEQATKPEAAEKAPARGSLPFSCFLLIVAGLAAVIAVVGMKIKK